MRNLGEVEIKGIDATGSLSLQPWERIRINLSGNYTYQQALDITNSDPTYRFPEKRNEYEKLIHGVSMPACPEPDTRGV